MTLYEFNSLTLEEKKATVWEKGVFLDNYITMFKIIISAKIAVITFIKLTKVIIY